MTGHDPDLASLKHDLSQLLWAIQGRARVLSAQADAELARGLARLAEDAATAAAMLADVDHRPADPAEVARGAWRQACDAEAARVTTPPPRRLTLPDAEAVAVPAHVLRRVLGNLFTNALEATPDGGDVHCTADVRDGVLSWTVQDEGPGLPAAARERLFERGATVQKPGGRGLGLAGARELLRRHGGDLVHVPGPAGARFTLELPLAAGPVDRGEASPASRSPVAGARLLVVDDDAGVRVMLQEVLGLDDHDVTVATDHDSALAVFAAGTYDAVLIDLGLPGRSGAELAAALRSSDPSVALVLLTGWGRERELQELPPELADFTGIKPLDQPELRALLARAVACTARRRDGRPEE